MNAGDKLNSTGCHCRIALKLAAETASLTAQMLNRSDGNKDDHLLMQNISLCLQIKIYEIKKLLLNYILYRTVTKLNGVHGL